MRLRDITTAALLFLAACGDFGSSETFVEEGERFVAETTSSSLSSFAPVQTLTYGAVQRVALPKQASEGSTIVAMVDGSSKLRLKAYRVTGGGYMTLTDTKVDPNFDTARDVVIERVWDAGSTDYYVTAARDQHDKLHLTSWGMNSTGDLSAIDHTALGTATEISITAPWQSSHGTFVIAVRDYRDKLRLISYDLTGGYMYRRDTFTTGASMFPPPRLGTTEVRDIVLVTTKTGVNAIDPAVITTVFKDGNADLHLYSWYVDYSANIIYQDTETAGEIQDIAALSIPDGLVTAVKDSASQFRLISWTVSDTGTIVRRSTSETVWTISEVAGALALSPGEIHVALRTSGNLRMAHFGVGGFPQNYGLSLEAIDHRGAGTNIDITRARRRRESDRSSKTVPAISSSPPISRVTDSSV